MLMGAGLSLLFAPVPINDFTGWPQLVCLIYAVSGAVGGIAAEAFVRWGQRD
jgi:hypothetical protein